MPKNKNNETRAPSVRMMMLASSDASEFSELLDFMMMRTFAGAMFGGPPSSAKKDEAPHYSTKTHKPYSPRAHAESPSPEPRSGDEGAEIPRVIHLFWAGAKLPEAELKNLMTFLFNTDDSWKIKVWTDSRENITKPLEQAGVRLDRSRIQVAEYSATVSEAYHAMVDSIYPHGIVIKPPLLPPEWQTFMSKQKSLKLARNMIFRLSVGLTQPAAVKDLAVPFILYNEGGYYFDLDNYAHHQLKSLLAPHGYVVMGEAGRVDTFASIKGHDFWLDSLALVQNKYAETFPAEPTISRFPNLSGVKDKSEANWRNDLIEMTGLTQKAVYSKRMQDYTGSTRAYHDQTNYPFFNRNCGCRPYKLKMGVTLRSGANDSSGWRKRENPKYAFDDLALPNFSKK